MTARSVERHRSTGCTINVPIVVHIILGFCNSTGFWIIGWFFPSTSVEGWACAEWNIKTKWKEIKHGLLVMCKPSMEMEWSCKVLKHKPKAFVSMYRAIIFSQWYDKIQELWRLKFEWIYNNWVLLHKSEVKTYWGIHFCMELNVK